MSRGIGTTYVLEVWDPVRRRYHELSRWGNRECASIQFHKPYNRAHTRRLVKITTTIDLQAKGTR